jgi:hypothetical protein
MRRTGQIVAEHPLDRRRPSQRSWSGVGRISRQLEGVYSDRDSVRGGMQTCPDSRSCRGSHTGLVDNTSGGVASTQVRCRHLKYSVPVNVERDLYLWNAAWGWLYAINLQDK